MKTKRVFFVVVLTFSTITSAVVDLSGEYWFGSLSADVSENVPWGKQGTVTIAGDNWTQEWDDHDGHHTLSSTFTATVQPDGSINVNFPTETYNIAFNGDVMMHVDTAPDADNRMGFDMMMRKATNIDANDIVGHYSFFGHWMNWADCWDDVGWGDIFFDPNNTSYLSYEEDDGECNNESALWALDATNAMININGGLPFYIGNNGILARFWPDPVGYDPELGYNFSIKKTNQIITITDMIGTYQVRFLETGPGGVPYTCGSGIGIIDSDGTLSVDAYYSDGEHDVFNADCTIGPGNMIYTTGGGNTNEGIISPNKDLIFIPEHNRPDPPSATDWLGGIFLIRNVSQSSGTVPAGKILWQAAKSSYYGEIIYVIHARITIEEMKACSLKGPNMADFEPAVWVPGRGQWSFEKWPFTLSELQQESFGIWQLKLIDQDDQESIYSFTISGTLQDSEFLPIPTIIEPTIFDDDVIAEHYNLRWNPNGAQNGADALGAEIQGHGFHYFSGALDLSTTEWNPGWLEIGDANETYCKVGYSDYRPDMIDTPTLVSGPAIDWVSTTAALVSGPKRPFTVKYSLDLIDDDRIDLADLTVFCSHWLEAAPSPADFDDGGMVEFEDFAIFAQHWLEDVNDIADHIFGIEFSTEWDYESPGVGDDEYDFEVVFITDDTVDHIEFTSPAGNTFQIPNIGSTEYFIPGGWMEIGREFDSASGHYEWYYGPCFYSPDSLLDYGDGLYMFDIYFVGGRVQQTTAWFGIPGTSDPIPQPTQVPVFTSFNDEGTVISPVTFAWEACTDTAADYILLEESQTDEELQFILPVSATGLDEPLDLMPGVWDDFELSFEVAYQSQNSDGIPVNAEKYSECDYVITVIETPQAYSGGDGTQADPYQISSSSDWQRLTQDSGNWDKSFVLTADVDGTGILMSPVGSTDVPFTGIFNGNGHILSNLNMAAADSAYGFGLFGDVGPEGRIEDLGLSNVSVNCSGAASNRVGGLCGINQGRIENCWVTGCVGGPDDSFVGGICGENYGGIIIDCFVSGTINGSYAVGGIAGISRWFNLAPDHWNPGRLQNNFVLGSVTSSGNRAGGLVGFNHSSIFYCYADCSVTGQDEVGGLVGYHDLTTVMDCYAAGSVSGNQDVGGLIGFAGGAIQMPRIYRSYARSAVAGNSNTGGLIGRCVNAQVVNSFWDIETTAQTVSACGGIGKTTLEMQTASTFIDANWDFDKPVWGIFGELNYPTLTYHDADINNNGQVDMEDLAGISRLWDIPFCGQCGRADLTGDRTVNIDDLNLFAQKWLWEDHVSDHVFQIEINTSWDYEIPDTANDDSYDMEISIETDENVVGIEFTTPAGNTFVIPYVLINNDGMDLPEGRLLAGIVEFDRNQVILGWEYNFSFFDASSLEDYGDGLYTFNFTYIDGRTDQTEVWFGRENSPEFLPQPTQIPVFTSLANGQTVISPVTFEWQACTDPAAERIELCVERDDSEQEFQLPVTATGLGYPLALDPGMWYPDLRFMVGYQAYNADGIAVYCGKQIESDCEITVQDGDTSSVVFFDTFDSGAARPQWGNEYGDWFVSNDAYLAALPSGWPPAYSGITSLPNLIDFTVEMDINQTSDVGVFLRSRRYDDGTVEGVCLIAGGIGGSYNGLYWHIWERGGWGPIYNQGDVPGLLGNNIHLKIIVQGNTYSAYVNGSSTPATTLSTGRFGAGSIGLYYGSIANPSFDNIYVMVDPVTTERLTDFAAYWLRTDCADPLWCGGNDFDRNGTVNLNDFAILASNWWL